MYAIPLDSTGECLLDEVSYPPNNDFLRSLLINEGCSEITVSYYELARYNDLLARVDLLAHRKLLFGIWTKRRIHSGRLEKRRLGQLSVDNIFTSGLPQDYADRYYSSS